MKQLNEVLDKTMQYRELFDTDSKMYKDANITIQFLIEAFIPLPAWNEVKGKYLPSAYVNY